MVPTNDEDPVESWGGLPAERQDWEDNVSDHPLDCLAIRAEAYQTALGCFDGMSLEESQRADLLVLRRSAAYNLAYLFKAQGALNLAADVLWHHVVFG